MSEWMIATAGLTLLMLSPVEARAQGGPPLITDDPDTPGSGYWEINLALTGARSRDGREYRLPLADINYGVGERIQLKFEIPWVAGGSSSVPLEAGLGNNNAGIKWRFLGQEGRRLAWSVYPQCEFNTRRSSAAKGLVDRGRRCVLPTELTLEVAWIEVNSEAGPVFLQDGDSGWVAGVSTELTPTKRLELLAEAHAEGQGSPPVNVVATVGGRHELTSRLTLLASGGRAVHGPPDERERWMFYTGLQLNLPGRHVLAR